MQKVQYYVRLYNKKRSEHGTSMVRGKYEEGGRLFLWGLCLSVFVALIKSGDFPDENHSRFFPK